MININIPFAFKPRQYQIEFLKSKKRFKLAIWHRRSGKSKTALNDQIIKTQLKKGIYYYFLPTYRQAKAVIWDALVREHVPRELVEKINETELSIYWKNGSIQRFAGCEDIDKHRGINAIDVVFDEFSEIKEDMWTVIIQPVLRQNLGTASFIFTPKGRNHAWRMWNKAKYNSNWYVSKLSVDDTGAIPFQELVEAQKETPEAFFKQEYYCEFLDDASGYFRRVDENLWHGSMDVEPTHFYQLGVDLAKSQDWTVITPFDLTTFKVGNQERFNQVDWNLQKARIEAVARRYNNARVIVDSTGLGDPIAEDLEHMGLNVYPFKFTETSRRQLLDNLAIKLEQDVIKIPDDEGLKDELKSFRHVLYGRKTRIEVPDSSTDDRAFSLALSVWEAQKPVKASEQNDFTLYNIEYK